MCHAHHERIQMLQQVVFLFTKCSGSKFYMFHTHSFTCLYKVKSTATLLRVGIHCCLGLLPAKLLLTPAGSHCQVSLPQPSGWANPLLKLSSWTLRRKTELRDPYFSAVPGPTCLGGSQSEGYGAWLHHAALYSTAQVSLSTPCSCPLQQLARTLYASTADRVMV